MFETSDHEKPAYENPTYENLTFENLTSENGPSVESSGSGESLRLSERYGKEPGEAFEPVAPPVRLPLKRPFDAPPSPLPSEPNDRDIVDVDAETDNSPYSMKQVMEETIAELRATLETKEQALLQTTIAATNYKQELDQSKTRNEHLRNKLATVVKANETLNQKVAAGGQQPAAPSRQVSEAEVAQMKEQWRVAQKSFERESNRMRAELAKTKAGAHQVSQELEIQTRARRSEAAHASLKMANLERDLEGAKSVAATESPQAGTWKKLSATAAATAVLMLVLGFWWQSSHSGGPENTAASSTTQETRALENPGASPAATSASPAAAASSTEPAAVSGALKSANPAAPSSAGSGGIVSRGQFQKALSRLNNVLYGPVGVTPEQILKMVRDRNIKTSPNVCNFQWNNGQPALYYGGAQNSLESSLDQCATAVDHFLKQPDSKFSMARR